MDLPPNKDKIIWDHSQTVSNKRTAFEAAFFRLEKRYPDQDPEDLSTMVEATEEYLRSLSDYKDVLDYELRTPDTQWDLWCRIKEQYSHTKKLLPFIRYSEDHGKRCIEAVDGLLEMLTQYKALSDDVKGSSNGNSSNSSDGGRSR